MDLLVSKKLDLGDRRKIHKSTAVFIILFIAVFFSGCSKAERLAYTPEIRGKVIDADTGKPIKEAVVSVGWAKEVWMPIDDKTIVAIKSQDIACDRGGNFKIPYFESKDVKYLSLSVYTLGYKKYHEEYQSTVIHKDGDVNKEKIELIMEIQPLKTEEDWALDINERGLPGYEGYRTSFIIKECKYYLKKFPNSPNASSILSILARNYLGGIGHFDS